MEMAGKEFTGKDKTVQKMTRDGLTGGKPP